VPHARRGRNAESKAERLLAMPVTPLHLGPAAVLKAGAGRNMSFTVFAFSQGGMDAEVLVRIAVDADRLHGFTNTILGASVALVPGVLLGRPVCRAFLRWWNRNLSPKQTALLSVDPDISWLAAWSGGILGVYSHWLLDAIMHADARALWPFARGNPFVDWLSIGQINALCLGTLAAGSIALAMMALVRRTGSTGDVSKRRKTQ
jgi:hypothetical protein